ncbi:MAG: UbiX family flavin prenyltransferase, partial [Rikenellaceae bacterium]
MKIVVGITGASGTIYARRLVERLSVNDTCEISVVFSTYGVAVARYEGEYDKIIETGVAVYDSDNMFCSLASGSSKTDAMVIVPASASTLSRVATGASNNLLTRIADVMLKERHKLIICLRETPLSLIHIDNMRSVTLAGAIVMPLSPSFYSNPTTISQLVDTQTDRIISLLGVNLPTYT